MGALDLAPTAVDTTLAMEAASLNGLVLKRARIARAVQLAGVRMSTGILRFVRDW
jgi:hypothetical protein